MYLTTAIAYVNGSPHVGHAYELILADAVARWWRLRGDRVRFCTGTDEHGQKIAQTAARDGFEGRIKSFVDIHTLRFRELADAVGATPDVFVRTTSDRHQRAVAAMWRLLRDKGFIYEGQYAGWYSVQDEAYYGDDEVQEHTSVEIDGRVVTSRNPVSRVTGSPVEWRTERSYFFKLSAFQEPLLDWYRQNPDAIQPESRRAEIVRFVEGGLRDLAVSRQNIPWGIPVPDSDSGDTVYVWLDALVNYLTAAGWPEPAWEKHWPADLHVVGKDILRFHAVYWPAFLMAAELPLPQQILAHGWILVDGRKMGKSLGNAIEPFRLIDEFGADAVRYALLREVVVGQDGEMSPEAVARRLNYDLANDLGNLVQRVATLTHRFGMVGGHHVFNAGEFRHAADAALWDQDEQTGSEVLQHFQAYRFNQGLASVFELVQATNAYVQSQEPWKVLKTDPERGETILYMACRCIVHAAVVLQPVIPTAAEAILDLFGIPPQHRVLYGTADIGQRYEVTAPPTPIFRKADL